MPPSALERALELLAPGAPVVFTLHEHWAAVDDPGGFRSALECLIESGRLRMLERSSFLHRRTTSGEPITYELFAALSGR